MCMTLLTTCMYVHHTHALCLWMPEKGVGPIGTEVTNVVCPPCRSWEPNSGPMQERLALLITEKSLQSVFVCILHTFKLLM